MANKIFTNIVLSHIESFYKLFTETSERVFFDEVSGDLLHPSEFGEYRERITKELLRFFTPQFMEISDGFVLTSLDEVSSQIDLIVFNRFSTTLTNSDTLQKFHQIESVLAILEVKSRLSKEALKGALVKLSQNKRLKESTIINNKERRSEYMNMGSMLICKSLDFKFENIESLFDELYQDIPFKFRHNMILSVRDGLFMYDFGEISEFIEKVTEIPAQKILSYEPEIQGRQLSNHYVPADDQFSHIKFFLNYYNAILQFFKSSKPDLMSYIEGFNKIPDFNFTSFQGHPNQH